MPINFTDIDQLCFFVSDFVIVKMSADQSVQVAVRIRPLVPSEHARGCVNIVKKTPLQPQVVVSSSANKNDMYTFSYVFAPEDTQEMLYENAVKSMVDKLFTGSYIFHYVLYYCIVFMP